MSSATIVPGSWWFGRGWLPWPTSSTTGVTLGAGLTLLANPDGPRSLGSADGTLGGLVLPPTLACDAGALWLLDRGAAVLRRFEPVAGRFVTVADWGGASSGAQRFGPGTSIAATDGRLALVDPERGDLVVVATGPMTVQAVLALVGPRAVAVAGHAGRFHVLDDAGGVHVTTRTMGGLERLSWPGRVPEGTWDRIVVDDSGLVCLVDTRAPRLLALTPEGRSEIFGSADEVRPRFTRPPLTGDRPGRFRVPTQFRTDTSDSTAWFDAAGELISVTREDSLGDPPYDGLGTWTSDPLDSRTLGCRWHRLVIRGRTPAGSTAAIATYTSDDPVAPAEIPPGAWSRPHLLGGRDSPTSGGDVAAPSDYAVLSPRGRYLTLRIVLRGDGWETPSIDELLVEPEAAGLERFLPAIYRSDDEEGDFLRRFLAMFGTELDQVEQGLRTLPARFSPRAVPEPWLDVLATELGVPLERDWNAAQRRAILEAAPRLYGRRGTVKAIQQLLHAHLEASVEHSVPSCLPVIVEGFRERPHALLGSEHLPLGAGVRMWSDDVVDRPVLGRPGRHDRISLVSFGDRLTDRFRVHANRFKVVVPRPLLPDGDARERFERLIAAEKPAHVAHELVTVEPRLIVGQQCRVGVDTYAGDWPVARLVGTGCRGSALGLGLRIAVRDPARSCPPAVGRGGRVGVSTVLI